jgi:hypothetical protein
MSTAKGSRSKIAPRREVNTRRAAIGIDSSSEDLTTKTRTKTVSVATTVSYPNFGPAKFEV